MTSWRIPACVAAMLMGLWLALPQPALGEVATNCSHRKCFGVNWGKPDLLALRDLDVNQINDLGLRPIHYAARHCLPAAHIYSMAEKGADMNVPESSSGYSPLQLALVLCRPDTVQAMLHVGADPNQRYPDAGGNALYLAMERRLPFNTIKMLVEYGVDVSVPNDDNEAPLMKALLGNNMDLFFLLLDAGADPNVVDRLGSTPAHLAAQNRDHELLRKLWHKGADLGAATGAGRTPLHLAAIAGMNPDLAVVFSQAGVDPNAIDNDLLTPLHYASAFSPADQVAALLVLDADPLAMDSLGETPLHYALNFNSDAKVVRALLRRGADPSQPDSQGLLPIQLAVGHPAGIEVMNELLEYGGSFEYTDQHGRTLLHRAVETGNNDMIVKLLDNGADPFVEDDTGVSALELAMADPNIVEETKERFAKFEQERRRERYEAHQAETAAQDQLRYDLQQRQQAAYEALASGRGGTDIYTEGQGKLQIDALEWRKLQLEKQATVIGHNTPKGKQNMAQIANLNEQQESIRERLTNIRQEAEARRTGNR